MIVRTILKWACINSADNIADNTADNSNGFYISS